MMHTKDKEMKDKIKQAFTKGKEAAQSDVAKEFTSNAKDKVIAVLSSPAGKEIASGAAAGAVIAAVVPLVGPIIGAKVGAVLGAYKHFTSERKES